MKNSQQNTIEENVKLKEKNGTKRVEIAEKEIQILKTENKILKQANDRLIER